MTGPRITPKIADVLTRCAMTGQTTIRLVDDILSVMVEEDDTLDEWSGAVRVVGDMYFASWRWTGRTWRLFHATDGWSEEDVSMSLASWLSNMDEVTP